MKENKVVSRRKMLASGAMIGAAAIVTPAIMKSAASGADHDLKLIPGSQPDFSAALTSLYHGLHDDAVFQKISPLAAIITHPGGTSVRAFTVCWALSTANESYQTSLFCHSGPLSRRRGRKGRTVATAQREILRPGESLLVTPFFAWSPQYYQKNSNPDWKQLLNEGGAGTFLLSQLQNSADVKIWLDATIFSDRTVLGPDAEQSAERLRVRRHAEHDEAVSLLRKLHAGASTNDLENILVAHGTTLRAGGSGPKAWYWQARRHHAQVLLKLLNQRGPKALLKALAALKAMHRTKIHNTTA